MFDTIRHPIVVGLRRRRIRGDDGFTLVELLVASMMGVVVMGAVASLMISTMRAQPRISGASQNVSEARWFLERMTHEIRNGIRVDKATASSVSFQAYVRRASCGGTGTLASTAPPVKCEITYSCSTTACTRLESQPETTSGTPRQIFSGINSSAVFSYAPSTAEATYIKATLHIPDPSGNGSLTISDGASLRNATLNY